MRSPVGTGADRADLVVVGGGVAGAAVALEASERGASVTLVERNTPGTGATGASAGMVAPQYESGGPDALFRFGILNREAFEGFVRRIESLSDWAVGWRRDGMLVAAWTREEDREARETARWQMEEGCRAEVLDPADARVIHPGVSERAVSWLWLPDEGQVDAQRLAVALADALRGAGVRVVHGRTVEGIRAGGSGVAGVALAEGGLLEAPRVVVAAGAWSAGLKGLPRRLPVRPVRGQIIRLRPRTAVSWPLVADHGARYLVPRENGSVLAGSTMEEVGFDERTTGEGRETLAEGAARMVDELGDAPVVETWAGLRPMSGDGRPILGPDPELPGLHYATGHGRNGILLAPLTGRAVAELALDGSTDLPWSPFRCDR